MPGTPMPVPDDPPRPELLLSLPMLRARLEEQRQFRTEQIAALSGGEASTTGPAAGATTDPGADTAHSQVTAALLAGARQALADIETALYRILNGQYGNCLECGAPIEMSRLRTLPQTALCADCHRTRTTQAAPATRRDPAPSAGRPFATDAPAGQDATLTM